jgi:membrane AbrB-like protein
MILLLGVAIAFALIFLRLRFPGGLLFGALAGSAILHGAGLIHAALPWWLGGASVITLGALVGSRFANTSARMLLGHLGAALGSFAVSMVVATFFVLIVARLFSFPIANIVIAFAPGAQDTMMVLALALHLDPVYVGAHHLARFLVVTFAIAVTARRIAIKDAPPHASQHGVAPASEEIHSAASARSLNESPSRCQTSTKASASASIKPSS